MSTPFVFQPSSNFWAKCQRRTLRNDKLPKNLFEHGPLIGSIGEIAFCEWYKSAFPRRGIVHKGTTSYDYYIQRNSGGSQPIRVEVKTKRRTPVPITPARTGCWEVSVPEYLLNTLTPNNSPDLIFAVSVQSRRKFPTSLDEIESIALIGWIAYSDFCAKKYYIPADSDMGDGSSTNPVAMWNVHIQDFSEAALI